MPAVFLRSRAAPLVFFGNIVYTDYRKEVTAVKIVVPSYYPAFSCIADQCRHSCCVGWEIVVDEKTAARYAAMGDALGERLRRAMRTNESGDTVMRLTPSGCCPMLRADGLCDIICEQGDGALCRICADHPRFRAFYTDRIEMGLGACCEAVAALLLSQKEPAAFLVLDDNGNRELPCAEEQTFFKERDRLLAIARDRSLPLPAREEQLLSAVGITRPPLTDAALFAIYSSLERLDPAWDTVLSRLRGDAPRICDEALCIPFEQLLVYFLWRHLPDSRFDNRLPARVALAVHSVRLIRRLLSSNTLSALAELTRAYCAEIEYSEENLETLLSTFDVTPHF